MFFEVERYHFFLLNTKHQIDIVELEKALRAWLDALIGHCVASNIALEESHNNFKTWTYIVDPFTFEIIPSLDYDLNVLLPFIDTYNPDKYLNLSAYPKPVTNLSLLIHKYAANYPHSNHHYDFAMIDYKIDPNYDKLGMAFSSCDNGGSVFFYMVQLAAGIPSLQKLIGIKPISTVESLIKDKHEPNPL